MGFKSSNFKLITRNNDSKLQRQLYFQTPSMSSFHWTLNDSFVEIFLYHTFNYLSNKMITSLFIFCQLFWFLSIIDQEWVLWSSWDSHRPRRWTMAWTSSRRRCRRGGGTRGKSQSNGSASLPTFTQPAVAGYVPL